MPRVDPVAYGLTDEMRAERPAAEAVLLQELPVLGAVRVVLERAVDLEVVAPARELEPVESPGSAAGCQIGDREVGPLAGEERYRPRQRRLLPGDVPRRRAAAVGTGRSYFGARREILSAENTRQRQFLHAFLGLRGHRTIRRLTANISQQRALQRPALRLDPWEDTCRSSTPQSRRPRRHGRGSDGGDMRLLPASGLG